MIFNKDKIFFILQRIIKNSTILITPRLRGYLYSFFLKHTGTNLQIHDNVTIKYPSCLSIGNNLCINPNSIIVAKGNLTIGDNVMLGAGVCLSATSHVFENIDIPMVEQGLIEKPIIISNNVWLGFNVVVLPGVEILEGSIVGANATVTKSIPKNVIFGGVPAKLIRDRDE